MKKISIVGKIGSGKTFVGKAFRFPIFNADKEIINIYKKNKDCFKRVKNNFPKEISSYPLKKKEILSIILSKKKNLKILGKIIHPFVRKKLNIFLDKNRKRKFVVLDIPLYFENKLNNKNDIIIFVDANNKKINNKLKKRPLFNPHLLKRLKENQISPKRKKKLSTFIVKNDFRGETIRKSIKLIKKNLK